MSIWGWGISVLVGPMRFGVVLVSLMGLFALIPKVVCQNKISWGLFPWGMPFVILCLFRQLSGFEPESAVFGLKFFLVLLGYLILINRIKSQKMLEDIIKILLICSACFICINVVYSLVALHWPFLSPSFKDPHGKNTLAIFISMIFPILYAKVINKKEWLWIMLAFVVGFAELYVLSRSGLVSFFITVGVFPLLYWRQKNAWVVSGLVAALFLLLHFSFGIGYQTFNNLKSEGSRVAVNSGVYLNDRPLVSLSEERAQLMWQGVIGWKASPLFGNGIGSFEKGHNGTGLHNEYIHILHSFGIVGFGAFALLLAQLFKMSIRIWWMQRLRFNWISAGLVVSMLCLIFWFNTITVLDSLWIWFLFACLTVVASTSSEKKYIDSEFEKYAKVGGG